MATLLGSDIIAEIKRAGVEFVVFLPDRTSVEHVLKPILKDPELRTVQVCKEDEGVSVCAGLHCAGKRALLLIQYTGFLDSINALRGAAVEGRSPVCMLIGLLGKEPGVPPTESKRYGLRIMEPILDVMCIEHHLIEQPGDTARIVPAIERAYECSEPVALLLGAPPA